MRHLAINHPSAKAPLCLVVVATLTLLLVHAGAATARISSSSALSCVSTVSAAVQWTRCSNDTLWIIETSRPITVAFSPKAAPTLRKRFHATPNALLLINGSYHDGAYDQPTMVGLLELGNRILSPFKPKDLQLSRVLAIDPAGRIASIRALSDEVGPNRTPTSARLQSGPAILVDGRLVGDEIAASLNGNDAYKRTAIGRTDNGETVIVISKTPRKLLELGALVLRMNDYRKRKLTLINLDGGPSTAIYSEAIRGMSYGADKVTPIVILVTK